MSKQSGISLLIMFAVSQPTISDGFESKYSRALRKFLIVSAVLPKSGYPKIVCLSPSSSPAVPNSTSGGRNIKI